MHCALRIATHQCAEGQSFSRTKLLGGIRDVQDTSFFPVFPDYENSVLLPPFYAGGHNTPFAKFPEAVVNALENTVPGLSLNKAEGKAKRGYRCVRAGGICGCERI